MSINNLLRRTDKGQLENPIFFVIFCSTTLIAYIFLIELLFHHSKQSFLHGLGFFSQIFLFLRSFFLVTAVTSPFLVIGSSLVWLLKRKNYYKTSLLISLFIHPLPFVIFALCNYLYLDRWAYSIFKYNVVNRGIFINILLFLFFIGVGFLLYFTNAKQIIAFTQKYKKIILVIILLFIGLGGGSLIPRIWHDFYEPEKSLTQNANAASPNIIILSYDMFETSNTPLTGYHRNTTPNLLRRKDEFFVFSNTVAIGTDSRAGLVAIFTGCSPVTTKVFRHPDRLLGKHIFQHLPAILKSFGYHNANYGYEPYTNPSYYNMLNGFSEINGKLIGYSSKTDNFKRQIQFRIPLENILFKDIFEEYQMSFEYSFGISDKQAKRKDIALVQFEYKQFPDVYKRLESLLKEKIPFMFHFHSNITHQPVFVRKHKVFSKLPDAISKESKEMRQQYKTRDGKKMTQKELTDLYDDSILQLDEEVEDIIRLLEKYNQYENTLLILTTDHEYLWGISGHPVSMVMRVPASPKGRIISERTWILDITPTILEILKIPVPGWMEGESLIPLIMGKELDKKDRFFHVVRGKNRSLSNITVVRGNYKITMRKGSRPKPNFYDISKGFRELEQKIQPADHNKKLLEQLRKETKKLIKKALRH